MDDFIKKVENNLLDYLHGRTTLQLFYEDFMVNSIDFDYHIINRIKLCFAEFTSGHITELELKAKLWATIAVYTKIY